MSFGKDIHVQGSKVRLLGTNHSPSDKEFVREQARDFNPDIVCAEALLGKDVLMHKADIVAAKKAAEEVNSEFWHIDAYNIAEKFSEIVSNMSEDEIQRISGEANGLDRAEEEREAMREISDEGHEMNLRRESAMFAILREALRDYERVLVVVGAAHFSELYKLLCAV